MQEVINREEAIRTIRANLSPRQVELEQLERWAEGKQYEGLPDWFTADVPLFERGPCIVYNLPGNAIASNVDLVLGEGLFPVISSNPGEDDSEDEGLDLEESKRVDRAVTELYRRTRFRAVSRQAFKHAQQAKSVAAIACVRGGRPTLEIVRSRWCEPTLDPVTGRCARLEIRYPYTQPQKQPDGKWKLLAKIYRRVIDEQSDTVYVPADADKNGAEPKTWAADPALTVQHNLGFCPVHWYACMRECSTVADYDGEAIHQECCDEVHGLNVALSQKHRAAIFSASPPIIETGVEKGYNPTNEEGHESAVIATPKGGAMSGSNPVEGLYKDTTAGKSARRMSPGTAWQYEQKDAKVAYLTLPPGALEAIDAHSADLRNKVCEMLAYVPTDAENVKYAQAMSAKAIDALRARQYARCNQYRDDLADNWIVPVTLLLLRVAIATKIKIKAIAAAGAALAKYIEDDVNAPILFVRWAKRYTAPTVDEEKTTIDGCVAAKKEGIVTKRMTLEKLKGVFAIDNVDQALEELETEATENQQKAVENAKAMSDAVPPKPGSPIGEKPGSKPATTPPAQE